VTTTADLAFALIVPHPTNPGTVVVNPDGSITCDSNLTCSGNSEPSASALSGDPLKTFTITIPSGAETINNGAKNMTVDSFTSNPETSGAVPPIYLIRVALRTPTGPPVLVLAPSSL